MFIRNFIKSKDYISGWDRMNKSKIFTKAELEEIERRKKGDKSDKTGIFSARVKPKIIELLEWFTKRKELKNLIEVKDGKN